MDEKTKWYKLDCPGCKVDIEKIKRIPRAGLIARNIIHSEEPITECRVCGWKPPEINFL